MSLRREILKSLDVPVIFVTGFPERLLTGTGVEPAFVITKPFDPDLLRAAISQALNTVYFAAVIPCTGGSSERGRGPDVQSRRR